MLLRVLRLNKTIQKMKLNEMTVREKMWKVGKCIKLDKPIQFFPMDPRVWSTVASTPLRSIEKIHQYVIFYRSVYI